MKKKLQLIAMAVLCPFLWLDAQPIKPLKIGDPVPEVLWSLALQAVNTPSGKQMITLNDYRDKLVILDFWATWCSSCLENFPKMASLQEQAGEKYAILLVNTKDTRDTRDKVLQFFSKQKHLPLISVVEDTALVKAFPHSIIPHYVWLKGGKVAAVTSSDELNKESIDSMLAGADTAIRQKRELNYDSRKPLFVDENGGSPPGYVFRSILTHYVDGLKSSNGVVSSGKGLPVRIYSTNTSVLNLYKQAFPSFRGFRANRILFKLRDSTLFAAGDNSLAWRSKALYNYELQFPPVPLDSGLQLMQSDLKRYFPFNLRVETRKSYCLVLKADRKRMVQGGEGKTETNLYDSDSTQKYLTNYPLSGLISHLDRILPLPLIDETGYTGKISLILPADLTNLTLLQGYLEDQGLILIKKKKKIDFLIVEDSPAHNLKQLSK